MNVRAMYTELFVTSLVLNLFDALLTGVAAFTIGYFIAFFYRVNILFAAGAGSVLFLRSLVKKIRQNKIILIETKYPGLKERLRTSYDYKDKINTVINELHSDIVSMMQSVDVNAFLSAKIVAGKIAVIVIMLFATLYFSSMGLDAFYVKRGIVNSEMFKRITGAAGNVFDINSAEMKNTDRLKDPKLLQIGDKDVNISIDSFNTELDIKDVSEPEENDFGSNYPAEIAGEAQETYEEKIPEEHKDIVKEYFKKINE